MSEKKCVFILVCSDGGFEPHRFVAAYDSEELAEKECAKRNDYEERNYGIRSSWEYSIQKHELKDGGTFSETSEKNPNFETTFKAKPVFVLVFNDGYEDDQFVVVYDSEGLAEKECAKRNEEIDDSSRRSSQGRRSWEYSIKKHELNSNIWKW